VSTIDGNGEVHKNANDIAREFMLGEIMAAAMKQLRGLDKPYMRLPESTNMRLLQLPPRRRNVRSFKSLKVSANGEARRSSR
jgi:hypothetical protein